MKRINIDDKTRKQIVAYSISGIIIVAFAFVIFKIGSLFEFVDNLLSVLSPFIWGVLFAFILSRFAIFLEEKCFKKLSFKIKRVLSSILSVLLLIALIVVIVLIITPQIVESVTKLSNIVVNLSKNSSSWTIKLEGLPKPIVDQIYNYSSTLLSDIWKFLQTSIPSIVGVTINTVSGLFNFIIGFIVAIYLLIDRERILESFRRFFKAYTSKKQFEKMTHIFNVTISKFYKCFEGKILDSLIIGVLCFILMSILNLDFAMLISVIVTITNVVPYFGPFIGAIPSALILLMIDPVQCLVFSIMILVLQQIDGNIIGPKIIGDAVDLSSVWIMFAILIGGAYFGFAGMILGVPIFSVIYYLINEEVDKRLKDKKIK